MTDLQQLFQFDEEDLIANRAGRVSERQRSVMLALLQQAQVEAAATAMTIPPLIACIVLYFAVVPALGDALGPGICIVIPLSIVLIYGGLRLQWALTRRLLAALARRSPGFRAWLVQRMSRYTSLPIQPEELIAARRAGLLRFASDGEHEHLLLDDEEFLINVQVEADERLWQLEAGQRYAIYYIPQRLWILSVERLPDLPA